MAASNASLLDRYIAAGVCNPDDNPVEALVSLTASSMLESPVETIADVKVVAGTLHLHVQGNLPGSEVVFKIK